MLCSFGLWHRVDLWMIIHISEAHITSIFTPVLNMEAAFSSITLLSMYQNTQCFNSVDHSMMLDS